MLDEQHRNLELITDPDDVIHELFRFLGVHARGRLIQQQKSGVCGKGTDNLQTALGAVRKAPRLFFRQIFHVENRQQLHGLFMLTALAGPIGRQTENTGEHTIGDLIMQTDAHIVLNAHLIEQADILEGSRQTQLVGLHGVHTGGVDSVDHHGAAGGLIHLCKQVKNGGLACAVGPDKSRNLRFTDGQVEIIYRTKAAKIDSQVAAFQHRALAHVPLGNNGTGGKGNHFGIGFTLHILTHTASPSFLSDFSLPFPRSEARKFLIATLLVSSITAISTTAYTSIR